MSEAGAAPVRDAASLILLRRGVGRPRVLMGQRGSGAAFMPDKFVFPGGAVDDADLDAAHAGLGPEPEDAGKLALDASPGLARALPLTAIRELWEETGLRLGHPDAGAAARATAAPGPWRAFLAAGLRPRTEALRFVFRAVTPPGRTRRFDARFFLAEAEGLADDPTDFSAADAELGRLQWIDLVGARELPLPFITGVVLSEIEVLLREPASTRGVPFFRHDEHGSHFKLL